MTSKSRLSFPRPPILLAAMVLVVALALRLHGIGFGLPALNDPDELMFEMGAVRMLRKVSLNPGWFGHPATTTMYVIAITNASVYGFARLVGWFPTLKAFGDAIFANPGLVILPGRVVMALFGVWAVALTHRLAHRLTGLLFGPAVALVAALLLAVSPVMIAWGQVIRSDIMAVCFMLMSMLASLRYAREAKPRDFYAAAAWLGVAIATKWPFALGGLAMAGALADRVACGQWKWPRALWALIGFGALALLALVVTSPFLVLAHDTVARNLLGEAQAQHLGATGGTPWHNAQWYLAGPLLRALGPVVLVLAVLGIVPMARLREARLIVLPVLLAFVLVLCWQHLVWERWALPVLPFACMAAALALAQGERAALARYRLRWREGPMLAVLALLLAAPLLWADLAQARMRNNDTRQRASQWAIAHIPPNSTVMIEHFGFDLYQQPWRILFPLGDVGCIDAKGMIGGKADYGAIDRSRGARANVDYGTMAPAKRATCVADFAVLTQYDRYVDEQDNFPDEVAAYRELVGRGQIVASFAPIPGISSGPVVRIIRFR